MAKVAGPLMSGSASGKFAGLEYKKHLSGNIVGRKSTSTPSTTPQRQDARVTLGRLSHLWAEMDPYDRNLWNAAAQGIDSGYTLWVKRSYWPMRLTGMAAIDPGNEPLLPDIYSTSALWFTGSPPALLVIIDPQLPMEHLGIIEAQPRRYATARMDPTHWKLLWSGLAFNIGVYLEFTQHLEPQTLRLRAISRTYGNTIFNRIIVPEVL